MSLPRSFDGKIFSNSQTFGANATCERRGNIGIGPTDMAKISQIFHVRICGGCQWFIGYVTYYVVVAVMGG